MSLRPRSPRAEEICLCPTAHFAALSARLRAQVYLGYREAGALSGRRREVRKGRTVGEEHAYKSRSAVSLVVERSMRLAHRHVSERGSKSVYRYRIGVLRLEPGVLVRLPVWSSTALTYKPRHPVSLRHRRQAMLV